MMHAAQESNGIRWSARRSRDLLFRLERTRFPLTAAYQLNDLIPVVRLNLRFHPL
jgi:hypothetical protein